MCGSAPLWRLPLRPLLPLCRCPYCPGHACPTPTSWPPNHANDLLGPSVPSPSFDAMDRLMDMRVNDPQTWAEATSLIAMIEEDARRAVDCVSNAVAAGAAAEMPLPVRDGIDGAGESRRWPTHSAFEDSLCSSAPVCFMEDAASEADLLEAACDAEGDCGGSDPLRGCSPAMPTLARLVCSGVQAIVLPLEEIDMSA